MLQEGKLLQSFLSWYFCRYDTDTDAYTETDTEADARVLVSITAYVDVEAASSKIYPIYVFIRTRKSISKKLRSLHISNKFFLCNSA